MSKVNPRLVYWIKAVTHHKGVPDDDGSLVPFTDGHKLVLISLAADCLDFGSGAGYCSVRMLAERSGKGRSTVMRALELARKAGLVEQTRRGHRITDETKVASEWRIIYPEPTSSSVDVGSDNDPTSSSVDVGSDPTSKSERPKVQNRATQGPILRPPTGNESTTGNESSTSSRASARDSEDSIFCLVQTTTMACPGCRREFERVTDEHAWECRHFGTVPSRDGDGLRVFWPVLESRAGPRPCPTCHLLVSISRQGTLTEDRDGKRVAHACPF